VFRKDLMSHILRDLRLENPLFIFYFAITGKNRYSIQQLA